MGVSVLCQVVGLARARGARLCAAFREFDTQRTGVINRTYLEALIHLSLARELNVAETQQLARFLDKVTDKCENVEYDTFVQWLYAPDSRLSELVLSRTSPPSHIRIFSSVLVGISRYT
ncbi:SDH2-2 [Symbiodinium sp. KB8]|nr:SDH2-2 [Symbiodinium sp. KB8]